MKKLIAGTVSILAFALIVGPVIAKDNDNDHQDSQENRGRITLNWEKELTPEKCGKNGDPAINVSEKVKNDVDSGLAGNWAMDNYTRHIKVWSTGDNAWCATVAYEGKFNAVAGQTGPGGTGTIGTDVEGEMKGGYRATFTGTLKSSPLWPTHGFVGTVDYGCDITGAACSYVSWTGQYFDGVGAFAQPWWGWIYRAEDGHGTWINASTGNAGNIF